MQIGDYEGLCATQFFWCAVVIALRACFTYLVIIYRLYLQHLYLFCGPGSAILLEKVEC